MPRFKPSFVAVVRELVSNPALQHRQCYILSGKFNQDPLENFFGRIRQSGGWSGNPNAKTMEQATDSIRLQSSSVMNEVRGTFWAKRSNGSRCSSAQIARLKRSTSSFCLFPLDENELQCKPSSKEVKTSISLPQSSSHFAAILCKIVTKEARDLYDPSTTSGPRCQSRSFVCLWYI